uniref:Protein kinase domain-containing protein n=1 Tax=Globodera rostochiensis TaxID=31243 RepID=A0A914HER8_GLORO
MAEELVSLRPGTRVSDRWTIIRKLGAGSFGAVYLCKNDQGEQAALKTEGMDAELPLLTMEAHVMRSLDSVREGDGKHFCRCLDLGTDKQKDSKTGRITTFKYIVMSLVGRGLDGLLREAGGRFSPGTAIGISIQMLNALRGLHGTGHIHRDIKPGNSTIGRAESNEQRLLYLIDFGLARKYQKEDGRHRRPREKTKFRGSPKYAPISAHTSREYNRKGDIESWFYVLIELYKGALPWAKAGKKREIGLVKVLRLSDQPEVRQKATAELLAGCPAEFGQILTHIDELRYEDSPDYELIERILRDYLTSNKIQEHPYDWEVGRRYSERD